MNQSDGGPNILCPETNRLFCFLSFLRGWRLLLGAFLKYSVFISIYVNSCTKLHRIQIVLVCVCGERWMDGWEIFFFYFYSLPLQTYPQKYAWRDMVNFLPLPKMHLKIILHVGSCPKCSTKPDVFNSPILSFILKFNSLVLSERLSGFCIKMVLRDLFWH